MLYGTRLTTPPRSPPLADSKVQFNHAILLWGSTWHHLDCQVTLSDQRPPPRWDVGWVL